MFAGRGNDEGALSTVSLEWIVMGGIIRYNGGTRPITSGQRQQRRESEFQGNGRYRAASLTGNILWYIV